MSEQWKVVLKDAKIIYLFFSLNIYYAPTGNFDCDINWNRQGRYSVLLLHLSL